MNRHFVNADPAPMALGKTVKSPQRVADYTRTCGKQIRSVSKNVISLFGKFQTCIDYAGQDMRRDSEMKKVVEVPIEHGDEWHTGAPPADGLYETLLMRRTPPRDTFGYSRNYVSGHWYIHTHKQRMNSFYTMYWRNPTDRMLKR